MVKRSYSPEERCVHWLGSGCWFDSSGVAVALLFILAPLFLQLLPGFKNRLLGTRANWKGVVRMTRVMQGVSKTLHNIGCGLAGGILSQTSAHSVSLGDEWAVP